MWRTLFYIFFVVLWLVVFAGVLELAANLYDRHERKNGAALVERIRNSGNERETLYMKENPGPEPPPGLSPSPTAPPRHAFFSCADDAARLALAVQRDEIILTSDRSGTVQKVFACETPRELAELASTLKSGSAIGSILTSEDPRPKEDVLQALETVFERNVPQQRDYPLILPDGTPYYAELWMQLAAGASDAAEHAVVFIRPSIFETLWYKYRPHLWRSENFGHWTVWTNNVGFRDDEVVVPKPPGVFRIVCIGASTTFEGPRWDLTYPKILQRRLREELGTDRIEVLNCGVYGLDSEHEVMRFDDYKSLEPDLFIHYNFANDATSLVARVGDASSRESGPKSALRRLAGKSCLIGRVVGPVALTARSVFDDVVKSHTIENMKRLAARAREAGVDLVICSFARPDFWNLAGDDFRYFKAKCGDQLAMDYFAYARCVDAYNEAVKALCAEEDLLYVPVAENVTGGADYFTDHCHMYLVGIEKKADTICDAIEALVAQRVGVPVPTPTGQP